jgi:hypothetical protein
MTSNTSLVGYLQLRNIFFQEAPIQFNANTMHKGKKIDKVDLTNIILICNDMAFSRILYNVEFFFRGKN